MSDLTPLEVTILKLVKIGEGRFSWYNIGTRLSMLDVPRIPNVMTSLKSLRDRGYLRQNIKPDSGLDEWEITELGLAALNAC